MRDKENLKRWRALNYQLRRKDPDFVSKLNARGKQYRQDNLEREKERVSLWKKKNILEVRKKGNEYRRNNLEQAAKNEAKRRSFKLDRTPNWFSEWDDFVTEEAFSLSKEREEATGIKWHVDHVIPLQGERVSGLHIADNIQVIPARDNLVKNNRYEV